MVKTTSPTSLVAEFDEPVIVENGIFTVSENEVKNVVLLADRRSVALTLVREMKKNNEYRFSVSGVKDYTENSKTIRIPFFYFENQEIPVSTGISGRGDFNISFHLKTDKAAVVLLHQGKDISVSIDADGRLVFVAGGLKVSSDQQVNSNKKLVVSLCREKNGMLKIYLNGKLEKSAYDATIVNPDIKANPVSFDNVLTQLKMMNRALNYKENNNMF